MVQDEKNIPEPSLAEFSSSFPGTVLENERENREERR